MNDFKRDASNSNKPAVAEPDAGKQKQQAQQLQDKESKDRHANKDGSHKPNK